jgi:hypothetical protein
MGRKTRVEGEYTDIKFFMLLTPSEYLELREAAGAEGETMAEYVRRSIALRFKTRNPSALAFGQRFR